MAASSPATRLFGGAMTLQLPQGLIDASDLRQIPDNQEVLLFPHSDVTIVVEVLQAVVEGEAAQDHRQATRYHFSSLAHDNEAETSRIVTDPSPLPSPPISVPSSSSLVATATPPPLYLRGLQGVRKFNKDDSPLDLVLIHLALWRLAPRAKIDLVMTWNEPLPQTAHHPDQGESALGDAELRQQFIQAAASLRIEDWGLFA